MALARTVDNNWAAFRIHCQYWKFIIYVTYTVDFSVLTVTQPWFMLGLQWSRIIATLRRIIRCT